MFEVAAHKREDRSARTLGSTGRAREVDWLGDGIDADSTRSK